MRDIPETATQADELVAGEIRAALARARMTQSALADQLGVSRAWVSRRLSGEVPLSVGDVALIAGQLGVAFASLAAPLDDPRSQRDMSAHRER